MISVLGVQVDERSPRRNTSQQQQQQQQDGVLSPTGRHISRATSVNIIPVNQEKQPVEIKLHQLPQQLHPEKENIPVISKHTGIIFHGSFASSTTAPTTTTTKKNFDLEKELEEVRRSRTDEIMYKTHQLDPPPSRLRIKVGSSRIYTPSSPPPASPPPANTTTEDDYALPGIVLVDMHDSLHKTRKNRNSFIQFVSEEPDNQLDPLRQDQIVPEDPITPLDQATVEQIPDEQCIVPSCVLNAEETPYELLQSDVRLPSEPLNVQGLKRKMQLQVTKKIDQMAPYKIRRSDSPPEGNLNFCINRVDQPTGNQRKVR